MEETTRKRYKYSMRRPILKKRGPQDVLDRLDDGPSESSWLRPTADRLMPWRALGSLVTRLIESTLRAAVTSLWESRAAAWLRGLPCFATLLLQVALWLLLGWLLSDLYLGLPCFLLALVYWLFHGPVRRAVSLAWGRGGAPLLGPACSESPRVSEWDEESLVMGEQELQGPE